MPEDDIIELTEEEAEEYDGDKCFKIKGSKEVIHKKNCVHNKHKNQPLNINPFQNMSMEMFMSLPEEVRRELYQRRVSS